MKNRPLTLPWNKQNASKQHRLEFLAAFCLFQSIGTVISSAYASRHDLTVKSILFTPLAETFSFPLAGSIAFHGTADPWAETDSIRELAAQKEVPIFLTQNANHSLKPVMY